MIRRGHFPIRMCMGCGNRRKKDEMVRLVRSASGKISVSPWNLDGRGFYLCPDLTCVKTAQKKGRRIGSWESVDLDLLRSQILLKTEECRRKRNGKD
jgi:predicted RNA-binding protein YlxR (DUF448 family)